MEEEVGRESGAGADDKDDDDIDDMMREKIDFHMSLLTGSQIVSILAPAVMFLFVENDQRACGESSP